MTVTDEMVKRARKAAPHFWRDYSSSADHMRKVLTAALSDQAGGWQDISTAPKDGTSFLATMAGGDGGPYYVLFWNDRFFESVDSGEGPSMAHITHWQLLPAPPPSSTAGEGK